MTAPLEIVILEDNLERRTAMAARLSDRFPQFALNFFHFPAEMISHLRRCSERTLVIALDHDLDLVPNPDGSLTDPGTGMDVAAWLSTQTPFCPVVIHSTNIPAAKEMASRLRKAGWTTKRITPYDDLEWIDAEWMTAVRQFLLDHAVAAPEHTPAMSPIL